MAGRTFRQTRPDDGGNTQRTINAENGTVEPSRIIQQENGGDSGTDRIEFDAQETRAESGIDTSEFPIEPTSIADSSEPIRRRRADAGQKRGPRGPNKKTGGFTQSSNLEKLMLSMHLMAATFLHVPELRIDAQESEILTKATLDIFKAYGVPDLSEKQLALANAMMAAGTVYGPRIIVIMNRKTSKPKIVPFPVGTVAPESRGPYAQPVTQASTPTPVPPQPNIVGAVSQPPATADAAFISASQFAADTSHLEPVGIS